MGRPVPAGVRLDTVGIQSHFQPDDPEAPDRLDRAIAAHAAEGVKVAITELEVDVLPRRTRVAGVLARERTGAYPYWNGLPPEVAEAHARDCDRVLDLPAHTRACPACSGPMWSAASARRNVVTLEGIVQFRLQIRSCRNPDCPRHRAGLRPEQAGRFALPLHEFGLDVIAAVGRLRHAEHRSVPELHADGPDLMLRGQISDRPVLLDGPGRPWP